MLNLKWRRSRKSVELARQSIRRRGRRMRFESLETRRLLASFTESGTILEISLGTADQIAITSLGNSYSLSLSAGTWNGTDTSDVAGRGQASLKVTPSGLTAFTSAIQINDTTSTGGDSVAFIDSGASGYFNNFAILLSHAAATGLSFSGTTNFESAASLSATVNSQIAIEPDARLNLIEGSLVLDSTGANSAVVDGGNIFTSGGSVMLAATGNVTVSPGMTVNSGNGPLTLAADVTSSAAGDDGIGTLSIGAGATVTTTGTVTLRGADVNIDTSSNPAVIGGTRSLGTNPSVIYPSGIAGPYALAFDSSGNLYVANVAADTVTEFAAGSTSIAATLTGVTNPEALVFDPAGNLYVADRVGGTVSVFAPGATTPNRSITGFGRPQILAVDTSGDLFVLDVNDNMVSEFAPGSSTAMRTITAVSYPNDIAVDSNGNLFVSDGGSDYVYEFAPGATTSMASYSTGSFPARTIAVDASNNLYVADEIGDEVLEYLPGTTTPIHTYSVTYPAMLSFDTSGDLYVYDQLDERVDKFAEGTTTLSATYRQGISKATAMELDSSGALYVANGDGSDVERFDAGGTTVSAVYSGGLAELQSVATDANGNLYVLSFANNSILQYAPGSTTASVVYSTDISSPEVLAVDPAGDVYVGDYSNGIIEFAHGNTTPVRIITAGTDLPTSLAVDAQGNLYVGNADPFDVLKFAPGATTASAVYSTGINGPRAIAFDASGDMFVANDEINTVSEYAPGSTTPIATYTDQLSSPNVLTFDRSGNLYVASAGNSSIVRFALGSTTASAVYSNVGQVTGMLTDGEGDLFSASRYGDEVIEFAPGSTTPVAILKGNLDEPFGLALDASGNLYVASSLSSLVVEFSPAGVTPQAASVVIQSSIESRPMLVGGSNSSPVAGINLSTAELAQIMTTAGGQVTIGDAQQTGNITFTSATPVTTSGASLNVVQSATGSGQVVLDDSTGTALNGNGGSISIAAGTGGIAAASAANDTAEISTTGAMVTLLTSGPIGSSTAPIQFADNANTSQQQLDIGPTAQSPSGVYVDGLGSLTLVGLTDSATVVVTARTDLVVAAGASIDDGNGGLTLAADVTAAGAGDDGVGTLFIDAGALVTTENSIVLRGADLSLNTSNNVVLFSGAAAVAIRSSLESLPIWIGNVFNRAAGIHLSNAELGTIALALNGTLTIGDSQQTGDISFVAAQFTQTGVSVDVVQSASGPGAIALNGGAAGTGLSNPAGPVSLSAGTGGVQVTLDSNAALPLVAEGITLPSVPLTVTLGFAPTLGEQLSLLVNTAAASTPTSGSFSNLADSGKIALTYNSVPYTLQASYEGGDGNDLVLTSVANPATQLIVATQPPASVTAGGGFSLTVAAEDSLGQVDTSYSGTASLTLALDPAGGTLGGTTTASIVNGVAVFSGLTLDKAGSGYTIQVASGSLSSATTNTVSVAPGTATQLLITTAPPTTVLAGAGFGFTVTTEDAEGNIATGFGGSVTVGITTNPAGGTLSGTSTVTASNGVAVFSGLSLDKGAAAYGLTVSSTAVPGSTPGFSLAVDQAPTIITSTTATFTAGTSGTFDFAASGYPAAMFTETGALPGGVTLGTDGVLSGIADAGTGGTYAITVQASNGFAPDATLPFTLTVDEAPAITSPAAITFIADATNTFALAASGFPVPTFSESNADVLPPGVHFDAGTGTLSGTPAATAAGTYVLHFTANNGIGAEASQTLTLLVRPFAVSGSTLNIQGTSGNDIFLIDFTDATHFRVNLNGVASDYSTTQIQSIHFTGSGGQDSTQVYGQLGTVDASLGPDAGEIVGANYTIFINQSFGIAVYAGASSSATLSGLTSAGNDNGFVLTDAYSYEGTQGAYFNLVAGFGSITGASPGQSAFAAFYSSLGDSVVETPTYSYMSHTATFFSATGFPVVYAYASASGGEKAWIYGSSGNDSLVATPAYVYMAGGSAGSTFFNEAVGYSLVQAQGGGGNDNAFFSGGTGDDVFAASDGAAGQAGTGYKIIAGGFAQIGALAASSNETMLADVVNPSQNTLSKLGSTYTLSGPGGTTTATGFKETSVASLPSENPPVAALDFVLAELGS